MPISPPQRGIGFDSKILSERSRKSRIHAGSFFISEIAETIAAFSPFSALNTACDGVMKSYLLISPTPVSSGADIKSVAIVLSYPRSHALRGNEISCRSAATFLIRNLLHRPDRNLLFRDGHFFFFRSVLRMTRPHFVISF